MLGKMMKKPHFPEVAMERRRQTEIPWYDIQNPQDRYKKSTLSLQTGLGSTVSLHRAIIESSNIPRRNSAQAYKSVKKKPTGGSASSLLTNNTSLSGSAVDLRKQNPPTSKPMRLAKGVEKLLASSLMPRPHSPILTPRYPTLPAISKNGWTIESNDNHSAAKNNMLTPTDPPPLVRSRTFDVIDSKMTNLPIIDLDSWVSPEGTNSDEISNSTRSKKIDKINNLKDKDSDVSQDNVEIYIEGKPLQEYISHAKNGLLHSRPPTRSRPADMESQDSEDHTSTGELQIYIRLPEGQLLLAESSPKRTLSELLDIVGNACVRSLKISNKGLKKSDLRKSISEIGIEHNTTLHLIYI